MQESMETKTEILSDVTVEASCSTTIAEIQKMLQEKLAWANPDTLERCASDCTPCLVKVTIARHGEAGTNPGWRALWTPGTSLSSMVGSSSKRILWRAVAFFQARALCLHAEYLSQKVCTCTCFYLDAQSLAMSNQRVRGCRPHSTKSSTLQM